MTRLPAPNGCLVQTGEWVLVLEGVCRVSIDQALCAEDPDEFDCAAVTQLELRPRGAPPPPPPRLPPTTNGAAAANGVGATPPSAPAASGSGLGPLHQPGNAAVQQPARAPPPPPATSGSLLAGGALAAAASGGGAADPVLLELGKQLRATTRALLKQLGRNAAGFAQPARRLVELLNSMPAWRAADVVAAALGTGFQVRALACCGRDELERVPV